MGRVSLKLRIGSSYWSAKTFIALYNFVIGKLHKTLRFCNKKTIFNFRVFRKWLTIKYNCFRFWDFGIPNQNVKLRKYIYSGIVKIVIVTKIIKFRTTDLQRGYQLPQSFISWSEKITNLICLFDKQIENLFHLKFWIAGDSFIEDLIF